MATPNSQCREHKPSVLLIKTKGAGHEIKNYKKSV